MESAIDENVKSRIKKFIKEIKDLLMKHIDVITFDAFSSEFLDDFVKQLGKIYHNLLEMKEKMEVEDLGDNEDAITLKIRDYFQRMRAENSDS